MIIKTDTELEQYGQIYQHSGEPICPPSVALLNTLRSHYSVPSELEAWRDDGPTPRVRESIVTLDGALASLSTKAGERASSTAAALQAQRDGLALSLATFEALGRDQNNQIKGALALEFVARIARVRAETAAAEQAYAQATRENVMVAFGEIEACKAEARQLQRELVQLRSDVKYPKRLPDPTLFAKARAETLALASKAPKRVINQHAALDQGRDADPALAELWIIYEPDEPNALIELRWESHIESRSGVAAE